MIEKAHAEVVGELMYEIDRLRVELALERANWSTKLDLMAERDGLQAEVERPLQHMVCDTHLQLAHERAEKAEAKLARVRDYVETLPYYIDEDNTAWNLLRLLDTE